MCKSLNKNNNQLHTEFNKWFLKTVKIEPKCSAALVNLYLNPQNIEMILADRLMSTLYCWSPGTLDELGWKSSRAYDIKKTVELDMESLTDELSTIVPHPQFFPTFVEICFQSDFGQKCLSGEYGIQNKTQLESYFINYANNPARFFELVINKDVVKIFKQIPEAINQYLI